MKPLRLAVAGAGVIGRAHIHVLQDRARSHGDLVLATPNALHCAQAPWRAREGAGPILLNIFHDVHNLRMLCGEITAVQAFASHAIRGFEVDDTVAISLKFAHRVLGRFLLSDTAACPRGWKQTSQENPADPSYPDEAGRSWFKPFVADTVDVVRDDPLKHQMAHFLAMIRGHAEPKVSVADGLTNLRVTEALVQAARLGATVTL